MDWLFRKISDVPEEDYLAIYDGLSASRRAHIDRLKKEADKKRSLLATGLVNRLLREKGICAALETGEDRRPYLGGCDLFVSITHSDQAVACVVSKEPVGIDMERIKPVKAALMAYICLPKEQAYVTQGAQIGTVIEQEQMLLRFFEVWTAKEAAFKKQGAGQLLAIDTMTLEKTHYLKDGYLITIV